MKAACLLGVVMLFLLTIGVSLAQSNQTNQTNQTIVEIIRTAPFQENLTCQAANDVYKVIGLANVTNITIGNVTYTAICTPQQTVGLRYDVEFASRLETNKTQTNILFIHDYTGATIQQRDWSFPEGTQGETSEIRLNLPFTCPNILAANINLNTCTAFFDQYLTDKQPLLFTLAGITKSATEELTNKTAELIACQNEKTEIDKQRAEEVGKNSRINEDFEACQDNLFEPSGSCYQRILLEQNSTSSCEIKKSELVPSYWMWISIIFIIMTLTLFARQFMWS